MVTPPAVLELALVLRPRQQLELELQFDKAFMHMEKFPADPNRGTEIGAAFAHVVKRWCDDDDGPDERMTAQRLTEGRQCGSADLSVARRVRRLLGWTLMKHDADGTAGGTVAAISSAVVYSEALLVPLPLPDFSMPYNVITLSSTVIAFFFGTALNTLVRKRRPQEKKHGEKNKKNKEG